MTAPNYKESTVNFHDADGWKVASPQDAMIRGKWWEVFNEPELNALEEQLNINNQNIKVSFENYMEARALIAEARAQYWPTITAGAVLEPVAELRQPAQSHRRHNTGQRFHFVVRCRSMSRGRRTLWGKIRNEVRSAEYAAQVSAADLELEKLTEQASLAQYYLRDSRPGHAAADSRMRPSRPIRGRSTRRRAHMTQEPATTSRWWRRGRL